MLAATLKEKIANKELHAIVLSYADSNHYLAGGQDSDGNLHILMHAEGKLTPFNSLRESRQSWRSSVQLKPTSESSLPMMKLVLRTLRERISAIWRSVT